MRNEIIVSDYGVIDMPDWMVALWHEKKDRLPKLWRNPENEDGSICISWTEANLLLAE